MSRLNKTIYLAKIDPHTGMPIRDEFGQPIIIARNEEKVELMKKHTGLWKNYKVVSAPVERPEVKKHEPRPIEADEAIVVEEPKEELPTIEELTKTHHVKAKKYAQDCNDLELLEMWNSVEERSSVLGAVEERINELKND